MIRQRIVRAGISRVGDSWKLLWDETTVILPPMRGLFYLSLLVVRPNREIPCDDLYATACGTPMLGSVDDPELDQLALQRLKSSNDPAAKDYLAKGTFRGKGRARSSRYRQSVASRIQDAIEAIRRMGCLDDAHNHLSRTITFGVRVAYYPTIDSRQVIWK